MHSLPPPAARSRAATRQGRRPETRRPETLRPETLHTQLLRQRSYQSELQQVMVQRLLNEARSDPARAELASRIGVDDPVLLDELSRIGLTTRTLTALRLIPLVLVAWADKHVDPEERRAVLEAAVELKIPRGSDAYVMLEHWLQEPPPAESADAWQRYMKRLSKKLGAAARKQLAASVKSQMTVIAKASGGHFGVGKVSAKERRTIESLMQTLRP